MSFDHGLLDSAPVLSQFRLEMIDSGIAHMIFDAPGRSMNVYAKEAISDVNSMTDWLPGSGLRGLLVSSGKDSAFCAGANLEEMAAAYRALIALPEADRPAEVRRFHGRVGRGFRALEKTGVPIAVAIRGLALGAGCEFAMAGHYRVMADVPRSALGLPESLVGLYPGGGGTQRMPRLVGLERSLPILFDGDRLQAREAVATGAAHEVVPEGKEIEAALAWLKSGPEAIQPWDRPGYQFMTQAEVDAALKPVRDRLLDETHGLIPSVTATLECLERGLAQDMEEAVLTEIDVLGTFIARPEPRDMVRTQFLGKQVYRKREKAGALPPALDALKADVASAYAAMANSLGRDRAETAWREALFGHNLPARQAGGAAKADLSVLPEIPAIAPTGHWIENPQNDWQAAAARLVASAALAAAVYRDAFDADGQKMADYAVQSEIGFPIYLGGPFALLDSVGSAGVRRMLG
ncbi:MAG: enoyl-CoA hydratase-related protein [Flavobacteriaceae bacterium]